MTKALVTVLAIFFWAVPAWASPQISAKAEPVLSQILKEESILLDLHIFSKSGIISDLENTALHNARFHIAQVIYSSPLPYDMRYNYQKVRVTLAVSSKLDYGQLELPELAIPWHLVDENGKVTATGTVKTQRVKLEVVPFRVKAVLDRESIDFGDEVAYRVIVYHERGIKVLADKERIEAGPWKLTSLDVIQSSQGSIEQTEIVFRYAFFQLPGKAVNLPGPVFYVKLPQSDKASEVRLQTKRIAVRSVLGPQTKFQDWKTVSYKDGYWSAPVHYGLGGAAVLFFLWGAVLLLKASRKKNAVNAEKELPEKAWRVKREVKRHLRFTPTADTTAIYAADLYKLCQRLLGAELRMRKEESLGTPAGEFVKKVSEHEAVLLNPFVELQKKLWSRDIDLVELAEIKTNIKRLIRNIGGIGRQDSVIPFIYHP